MKKGMAGAAIAAALVVAAAAAPFAVQAQTRDRRVAAAPFLPFEPGSEIGAAIRELDAAEAARARLDRPGGVVVVRVREGSPASRAGLRPGDIIIEFDGERVRGVRHFSRLVLETPAGRTVRSEILRDGTRQRLELTPEMSEPAAALLPHIRRGIEQGLRSLPEDFDVELYRPERDRSSLGMTLSPLTNQLASYFGVKEGVLVSAVESGSPAAGARIRAGDVVTAVDGRVVRDPRDVSAAARRATGTAFDVRIVRDKKEIAVKVTVPERPRGQSGLPV